MIMKYLDTLIKKIKYKLTGGKYKLTGDEAILWDSIVNKATNGYSEFCNTCEKNSNYMGWPWVNPPLSIDERELVNKIHEYFYPGDYIVDSIGGAQADYAWYEDIKNKVKIKN